MVKSVLHITFPKFKKTVNMKRSISFIRTTVMGGAIFLVPFFIIVFVLMKAGGLVKKIIEPWVIELGIHHFLGRATLTIMVAIILILISVLAGMVVRSGKIKTRFPLLDDIANRLIPGYAILKAQSGEKGAAGVQDAWQAICLNTDDGWRIGFIVDKNEGKYRTVYLPEAPRMDSGEVRILVFALMEFFPISAGQARQCLIKFGAGGAAVMDRVKPV